MVCEWCVSDVRVVCEWCVWRWCELCGNGVSGVEMVCVWCVSGVCGDDIEMVCVEMM